MKALEKLRNALSDGFLLVVHEDGFEKIYVDSGELGWLGSLADEVEAELADGWMELPKDEDGIPIKVGDEVKLANGTVVAVTGYESWEPGRESWYVTHKTSLICHADLCRHVRRDPLKELLESYYDTRRELLSHGSTAEETDGFTDQYAEKIRELLKEGE